MAQHVAHWCRAAPALSLPYADGDDGDTPYLTVFLFYRSCASAPAADGAAHALLDLDNARGLLGLHRHLVALLHRLLGSLLGGAEAEQAGKVSAEARRTHACDVGSAWCGTMGVMGV